MVAAITKEIIKHVANQALGKAVDSILKIAKSRAQLRAKLDKELPPVLIQCMKHAEEHGDVSYADRLVKGLRQYDQQIMQEVVFWFRSNSPIQWGPDTKCFLRDKAKFPFKVEQAEKTPFNKMPEVETQRRNAERTIQPFSAQSAFNRINGLLSQLEKAQTEEGRGIEGDPQELKTEILEIIAFARAKLNIDNKSGTVTPIKAETETETLIPAKTVASASRRGRTPTAEHREQVAA